MLTFILTLLLEICSKCLDLRTVPTIVIAHNVLHISRYLDFLLVVLTNAGVFLHGLNLRGESRT